MFPLVFSCQFTYSVCEINLSHLVNQFNIIMYNLTPYELYSSHLIERECVIIERECAKTNNKTFEKKLNNIFFTKPRFVINLQIA